MKYATLLIAAAAAAEKKICKDASAMTGYAALTPTAGEEATAAKCKAECDKIITADTAKADKDFCCAHDSTKDALACALYSITKQATWATLLADETA